MPKTDGTQKSKNVYGISLISRTIGTETVNYLYNGHGDVVALIDSNGQEVVTYYYDEYGNVVEETGNIDNSIRYAGYQYDSETKTYYLMARMYDPEVARFLQEDTIVETLKMC